MLDFEKCKSKIENFDAGEIKDKIADIVAGAKVGDLFKKNEKPVIIETKKEKSPLVVILAIIGCIAAVAAISYAVYRFCIRKPDYLEDYDDDDFEDFDDFEDEDESAASDADTVSE